MSELASWALALMLTWVPPGRSHIKAAKETPEEGRARYAEIAAAIAEVADGNKRRASLLLAVSYHESGWRRDVDYGVGPLGRGDLGTSCTLYQFHYGRGSRCDALLADRKAAAAEALKLIRRSFATCRRHPVQDRLAVYTGGDCVRGAAASRIRMSTAEQFLAWKPKVQ